MTVVDLKGLTTETLQRMVQLARYKLAGMREGTPEQERQAEVLAAIEAELTRRMQ